MALDDLDDRLTVTFEGGGWTHHQTMLRMRLQGKHGGWLCMILRSKAKKPANFRLRAFVFFGSPTWTRTRDLRINSPSLYRLSYQGIGSRLCPGSCRLSNCATFNKLIPVQIKVPWRSRPRLGRCCGSSGLPRKFFRCPLRRWRIRSSGARPAPW